MYTLDKAQLERDRQANVTTALAVNSPDTDIDLTGLLAVLPDDVPLSLEIPTQALRERGVSALERARLALAASRRLLG